MIRQYLYRKLCKKLIIEEYNRMADRVENDFFSDDTLFDPSDIYKLKEEAQEKVWKPLFKNYILASI